MRKYYGIAPDGASLAGIYLWESKAAAEAFYTPEWLATGDQALGIAAAAPGMGNSDGGGERGAPAHRGRVGRQSTSNPDRRAGRGCTVSIVVRRGRL